MAERGKYKTRQRDLVSSCLANNEGRYLTVDEIWSSLISSGERIGRSTVYRNLESMVSAGFALKVTAPGGEARYRIAQAQSTGQLVCLDCGQALPLDCHMVGEFTEHVLEHHSFKVEPTRTVLYGVCEDCMDSTRDHANPKQDNSRPC
ncbi:MAG: transcriptional repressor [Atopobiaceae bacterium]|nr:transcriptional repressor [Atopobiaceae bacterium]